MKLKTRTKRTICALIGTAGVLLMAITAMISDSINIQLSTIIKLEVLAQAMCWGGFYKGGYLQ
jgi:hypothetical protein